MTNAGEVALILFAHGSRDPDWATPLHAIKQRIEASQPRVRVRLAFLELMQPSLGAVVSELAASSDRVLVAPLFMSQGAHLKRDLAKLVDDARGKHPSVEFEILPSLGEMDPVLDAICASIGERALRVSTT